MYFILFQTYHTTKMESQVAEANSEIRICENNNATASENIENLESEISRLKNELAQANSKSTISRNPNSNLFQAPFQPSRPSNSLFGSFMGNSGNDASLMANLQSKLAAKESQITNQLADRDAKISKLESKNMELMENVANLKNSQSMLERLSNENGQLQMQLRQLQEQVNQASVPQHMTHSVKNDEKTPE